MSLPGSKLKPPMYPPLNPDEADRLLSPGGSPRRQPVDFDFQDFTFLADESATITESWYSHAKAFFNIRLGDCPLPPPTPPGPTITESWYSHAKAFFNIRLGDCPPRPRPAAAAGTATTGLGQRTCRMRSI